MQDAAVVVHEVGITPHVTDCGVIIDTKRWISIIVYSCRLIMLPYFISGRSPCKIITLGLLFADNGRDANYFVSFV